MSNILGSGKAAIVLKNAIVMKIKKTKEDCGYVPHQKRKNGHDN